MSRLHELTVDLGTEVEKFTSKIEEEMNRIKETKARFDRQRKERAEKEEESCKLNTDFARIQNSCFTTSNNAAMGDETQVRPFLTKALGEIRAVSQKIRDERMEIVAEYKAKLDQCGLVAQRNQMLETFVESWQRGLEEGKELTELPDMVKNLYYNESPQMVMEEALKAQCDFMPPPLNPANRFSQNKAHQETAKPSTTEQPGIDETMVECCSTNNNAVAATELPSSMETSLCRMRTTIIGEPSILGNTAMEFSRLVDFDATLTDVTGCELYAPMKHLSKAQPNDDSMDQDLTL